MVFKRVAAFLLAASIVTVPAFAHGHGGAKGHRVWTAEPTTYTVCPLDSCEVAGRHVHNGVTYCGYDHGNGFCDGACRALCPYEDCTLAGPHTHDGVDYCGYGHGNGYCDGSCWGNTADVPAFGGHHRGCHH